VIEHADGTDGRVIGQGLVGDLNVYEDVSWSPSGKWMSWRGSVVGAHGYQGWAVRTDGSKSMTQLSNLPRGLYSLAWSPTEDLLAANYVEPSYPHMTVHMVIINPETDAVIARTAILSSLSESYGGQVVWLPDGSGVYLTSGTTPTVVTILYKNGQTKTLIYSQFDAGFANVTNGYVTAPMWLVVDGIPGSYFGIDNTARALA
jgi:Tol biopolymer transport system component